MKKVSLLIIFLAVFFIFPFTHLYSQHNENAKIFVQAVDGIADPQMRVFFYEYVFHEVNRQYRETAKTKRDSDFTLRGSLGLNNEDLKQEETRDPVPGNPFPRVNNTKGKREFFSWDVNDGLNFFDSTGESNDVKTDAGFSAQAPEHKDLELVFLLELLNSKTNHVIGEQYLVFTGLNENVYRLIPIMVNNLLSIVPSIHENIMTDDIRDRWLFLNANFLWVPRIYSSKGESISWLNMGLGFTFEYQFLNFLSAGVSFNFTQDWIVVSKDAEEYRDIIMEIPIMIKGVFKPGSYFMLEPFTGIALNISLTQMTKPSLFSWFIGLQAGVKAGPGFVTLEPRFAIDLAASSLERKSNSIIEYNRMLINIGIGYKIGLLQKTKK